MNLTKLKLSITCLALAVTSGVALAQVIPLTNPGFEEPNFGKINYGFTAGGIPGWFDTGATPVDTGVENGGHSGIYQAYEQSSDDGAYQISSYQIQSGDQITVRWWARGSWNGTTGTFDGTGPNDPVQTVTLLRADTTGDAFATTSVLSVTSNGLPGGPWIQYSLTYTNTSPGDVGKYFGVAFITSATSGKPTGSYSALDDFTMAVLRPGDPPTIVTPPASQTAFVGSNVSFTVTANGATGYQWQAGAVGSGVYTNLLNAGKFSGVTTTTLTITNVTLTNNADFVVVASNGSGSVTSAPPANLTVAAIIYQENFNLPTSPDQSITNVGWRNDIQAGGQRIFTGNGGLTFPNMAVWSWVGNATNEAFYATTATANGGPYGSVTGHMAFPGINLATVANLSFSVGLNSTWSPQLTHCYIVVQMNFGNWYVSTTELLPQPASSGAFVTDSLIFNPSASAWNQLTVSGNGANNTVYPIIGSAATANLVGYITGVGIVCSHDGNSTIQFDNYTVLGAIPPTALPVINSPPSSRTNYTGTTATFNVAATTNGTTAGLTYQWRAGTVGSGVYASLSDGGQFSGTTSGSLVISNVTSAANYRDYVVVVADGAGSVTSAPPARLTVVDSAPRLTSDAVIYPDAAPGFGTTNMSIHAGNHNTLHLTASFTGSQPISYQWRVSPNADGSAAVNKAGATSSTLTLSSPQESDTGYYSLQASNNVSATVTNSAWVQLTVLPASTALIKWSAPVAINGLTAAQILGLPGTFVGAESFTATAPRTVQVGGTDFLFDNTGAAASYVGQLQAKTLAYTGPSTGDTNLDWVLGVDGETSGGTITLNNLTAGLLYSAQLFALNDVAGVSRVANYSDPNDAADVSASFAAGDNVYVLGTFVAADVTQAINFNQVDNAYLTAVIIRQVPPTPTLSLQRAGSSLQVDYANGILLEATNITGPWTTNSTTTPYTFTPTDAKRFFRVQGQ